MSREVFARPVRPAVSSSNRTVRAGAVLLAVGAMSLALACSPRESQALAQEAKPAGQTGVTRVTPAERGHLFRFDVRGLTPRPKTVHLAGTFNSWNRLSDPMIETEPGVFTLRRVLADGIHYYKFVTDGENWVNDPASDKELETSDGHGGVNSALLIGPDARKLPKPEPGAIRVEALTFDPASVDDLNVVSDRQIRFGLRLQADDAEAVGVYIQMAPGAAWQYTQLHSLGKSMGLERFTGVADVSGRVPGKPLRYLFAFRDGTERSFLLTRTGLVSKSIRSSELPEANAFETDAKVTFATPEWTKSAVWYQIFPERFRNGERANDPGDRPYERLVPWTSDWWATLPGETPGAENFYKGAGNVWQRRYGGDIQGVQEKLSYLRELGVTAIYFNPVFEAASMHKYDARDFRHIDDNFTVKGSIPGGGDPSAKSPDPALWVWTEGDKVFLEFVAEAKKQGFKVVLDLVCNHVGRDHPYFRDVVEKGAKSQYAGWFQIEKFADVHPTTEDLFGKPGGMHFKAWDGPSGQLPVFKHDPVTGLAKGPYDHMMNVTRRWLAPNGDPSKGIDGFRLDVANEVPSAFWRDWRKVVKETKPDAYISGEIWSPAQEWLQGDQFDAVMNYQFAMAGQRFFVNQAGASKPSEFGRELERLTNLYPLQSVMSLMNLYDSHDTDRLAGMFVNPDRPYDGANRLQDNGPDYSPRKPTAAEWERFKQAVAFQMTFIGSPMVYYGSEAGMWSPDDPSNRMPMVWKDLEPYAGAGVKFDQGIFDHYRRYIAVRHTLPALSSGYVRVLLADDASNVVAFSREDGRRTAVVVINRTDKAVSVEVPMPASTGGGVIDWANPANTEVTMSTGVDARPMAKVKPGVTPITVREGKARVTVGPWGVAVLASPEAAVTHSGQ